MKIYCQDCDTYCGEIRDATLKKNITFLCPDCNGNNAPKKATYNDVDVLNQLKSIFGMR